MQKQIALLVLLAVAGGAILALQFLRPSDEVAPVVSWSEAEEVQGSRPEEADPEASEADLDRTAAAAQAPDSGPPLDDEPRVEAILRGRVVDAFGRPVAGARVWLEIGRSRGETGGRGGRGRPGGRGTRRIPEPVETNRDGLFAFQGQAFRALRVALQVKHRQHAAGLFERDLGDIQSSIREGTAEVELGDLTVAVGGTLQGRVTDLDGNGVANAELTLEPGFANPLRWQQNRDELLPKVTSDASGYYAFDNVPAPTGERDGMASYAVAALARMHTPGRSRDVTAIDAEITEVADIRLGPGYEITGYVRDAQDRPIAKASVQLRASLDQPNATEENRGRRGGRRGGPVALPGFGRGEHRTETDEQGRFFLEHLPGTMMELRVDAKGYLDFQLDGVDPRTTAPIHVQMQQGLVIRGLVQAPDGSPVGKYAVQALRLRGLPDPSLGQIDPAELSRRLRDPDLDPTTRAQLERQQRSMRDDWQRMFRSAQAGGRRDRGGRGGEARMAAPEAHPGGRFEIGALQEGIYELHVQAADFARFVQEEIVVAQNAAPPELTVTLDPGVYVVGVVHDAFGRPIADAEVQLRAAELPQPGAGGERNGFDFSRMAERMLRSRSGTTLQLESRTNRDGQFSLRNVPHGTYQLTATADGYATERSDAFALTDGRSDFELTLAQLATLTGTVRGVRPEELGEAVVGVAPLNRDALANGGPPGGGRRGGMRGFGGFRTARIESDGSYRIEDLQPGPYVVRAFVGSARELMRELGPSFLDGSLQADTEVRGGDETRFDLELTRPRLGALAGSVLHNGNPASGFRVDLQAAGEAGTANAAVRIDGGRGNNFGRMINMGSRYQATVAADGSFRISKVPAGDYLMRIRSDRRGATLHEEPVRIEMDSTAEGAWSVTSASLRGTIAVPDEQDPKQERGSVALVLDQGETPTGDLRQWLRSHDASYARIESGAFEFESLRPGSYLMVVQPRGRATTQQHVTIGSDLELTVTLGAAEEQPPR